MLGVLLETNARRPRRSGGAALSVATHLAIIAAVSVASAHGSPVTSRPEKPVFVHVTPPAEPPHPAVRQPAATVALVALLAQPPGVPSIIAPTIVPTALPSIELSSGMSIDSLLSTRAGAGDGHPRGMLDGGGSGDSPSGGEWRGTELLMRVTRSVKPRYPETLRQAGIDGRVLIQFVVDTAGAIDLSSVQVLSSTHEQFTRAVRDILSGFRFKPAEVGGHRVRSLAEMPFEFAVVK